MKVAYPRLSSSRSVVDVTVTNNVFGWLQQGHDLLGLGFNACARKKLLSLAKEIDVSSIHWHRWQANPVVVW